MKNTFTLELKFNKKQERVLKKIAKANGQTFQEYIEEFTVNAIMDFKDPQEELNAKCKEE